MPTMTADRSLQSAIAMPVPKATDRIQLPEKQGVSLQKTMKRFSCQSSMIQIITL
jgi:hypothetical protein